MKEILLSQGKIALIDDEDFEIVNRYKWYANKHRSTFYARTNVRVGYKKRINIKMHRLILNLTDQNIIIDHVDGNGCNNQKDNLRICTNSQNQANRPKRKYSIALYKGISQSNSKKGGWRAQIKINGRVKSLGYFNTQEQAALAYNEAAKIIHGEFANINILPCGN